MGVPKRRQSKSRKNKRRSHFKLEMPARSVCPQCGEIKTPHRVCANCGYYKGRAVIAVKASSN